MLNKFHTLSTFAKINLILLIMLVPLLGMNYYSNHIGTGVVRDGIHRASETYMSLLTSQIDTTADQLSVFSLTMNRDSYVAAYTNYEESSHPYDKHGILKNINEKLNLNSLSLPWTNQFTIYSPVAQEALSNGGVIAYDEQFLSEHLSPQWTYLPADNRYAQPYFVRHTVEPQYSPDKPPGDYRVITEASFSVFNLVKMLDQFKNKENVHDPFLYSPGHEPIVSRTSKPDYIHKLQSHLSGQKLADTGHETVELHGKPYLVTYQITNTLQWYLVDYVPLEHALAPMYRTNQMYYISAAVLITLSLILSYFIYRNVQIPIIKLTNSARAIARGDFSAKIDYHPKNEFQVLVYQFNSMAGKIKELIETIYESKIRLQQATLKQLQAQIDPHFLYNSLNFIKYCAKSGDEEAVVSMAVNLGAYYRTATRSGDARTTLEEELKLIRNYLEIHKLRMHEMNYEIHLPEELRLTEVPRLIVQPVVENAIVHGISHLEQDGFIRISAESDGGFFTITVEDSGPGLSRSEQEELMYKVTHAQNEHDLCGLWNVAQRLVLQYGDTAGIGIESSVYGGLKVCLYWPDAVHKEE
ncbi:sensor histidine kinase [Paenibacillus gansuensis]|uniref:Sensor histidine kinase n=1 Tax=Paenibacillus gansuensis TaxID=306542 RepID=A0ABW5PA20_9BACL